MSSRSHWETVYERSSSEDLGWFESLPSTLELVLRFSDQAASVIDVGAGDSRLVDALVDAGYEQLTLVDLSSAALDRARARLGSRGTNVVSIQGDVTDWTPPRRWQLWHDRAVFHFLTDADDRLAYKAVAAQAVAPGGTLIVATFAHDGPEQCAGLPVRRYDAESLSAEFEPQFSLVEHHRIDPDPGAGGDQRPYVVVVARRQ